MKKYDVVTLGAAVVDIVVSPVDKGIFTRGSTSVDDLIIVPGGDAVNQAILLKKLGADAALCCRVGKDALGGMLMSDLEATGVDTTHIAVSADSVTSAAIVLVDANGQRNYITKKGNNYDFCRADIDTDAVANTRALSVGSIYSVPKLEDDGLKEILQHVKQRGVVTFADMGSDKKRRKLAGVAPFLPYIDYFMPSETESVHLTGCTDCRKAAAMFRDAGAKNVIIKLGGHGVFAECDGFEGFTAPFDITPTDTTGCGDAFCAGFIHHRTLRQRGGGMSGFCVGLRRNERIVPPVPTRLQ